MAAGHFARQHGADGAVHITHGAFQPHRLAAFNGRLRRGDQVVIQRGFQAMILLLGMMDGHARLGGDAVEDARQINALGLPVADGLLHVELVHSAGHFLDRPEAQLRHDHAQFFGHEEEVVDHMLGLAGEALAQDRVLGRDTNRAGVQMALAHHDAAGRDQRRSGKAELVSAQQRGNRDVAAGAQAAIGLNSDTAAQAVQHQGLLGLGQADFPRRTRMGQRGQR